MFVAWPNFSSPILILLLLVNSSTAWYISHGTRRTYSEGDTLPITVNHVSPNGPGQDDKLHLYSYDYYNPLLGFCVPKDKKIKQSESLGQSLFGDRIFNSPYEDAKMLEVDNCHLMCASEYTPERAKFTNDLIRRGYSINLMIDGVPIGQYIHDSRTHSDFISPGFEMGYVDENKVAHLYNHFDILVKYHQVKGNKYRIVGATMNPQSLDRVLEPLKCSLEPQVALNEEITQTVVYTYHIHFESSPIRWSDRWDQYLHSFDPTIQWITLLNFGLIAAFLVALSFNVLFRNVANDILRFNNKKSDDEIPLANTLEEKDYDDADSWNLISGDVFRKPNHLLLLSILVGSGIQLAFTLLITLLVGALGFISPETSGSLATWGLISYSLFSYIGGYTSSTIYKIFQGEKVFYNMIFTPLVVPGTVFILVLLINNSLINVNSSGAIPFKTVASLFAILLLLSFPLSLLGSYIVFKKNPNGWLSRFLGADTPIHFNLIERQIPPQPFTLRLIPSSIISGIFPFGAICAELTFILSSLWFNKIYYMFGFLSLAVTLMIISVIIITTTLTYYNLRNENHKWSWLAFTNGFASAFYMFVHALVISQWNFGDWTSGFIYIMGCSILCLISGLILGSIGWLANWKFVLKMFNAIKRD